MLLTVDIGTSNFKSAVFDYEGERLAFSSHPLFINGGRGQWLNAYNICRDHLETRISGLNNKIDAIVITGNGPTLVPVLDDDSEGDVKFWLDSSAENYCNEVSKVMGGHVDAKFFLPKILKIKNEEPGVYSRVKHFLGCPEYLAYCLTGEARAVFPSFGFDRWFWDADALSMLKLDAAKFPPFARPGEIIGYNKKIPVIAGGPDFFSAILGAGIAEPGIALDRTGSSEGINLCAHYYCGDGRFMCYGHPVTPYWNISKVINSSGTKITKACEILGLSNVNDFISLAMKGQSRASSILEDLCLSVKEIIEMMEDAGNIINELRVTGGLASIEYLNKMKSKIINKPIIELEHKEAELSGCAIIGARALGKYANYAEACEKMARIKRKFS